MYIVHIKIRECDCHGCLAGRTDKDPERADGKAGIHDTELITLVKKQAHLVFDCPDSHADLSGRAGGVSAGDRFLERQNRDAELFGFER